MLRVLFPCLCLGVAVEAGAIKPDREYIRYPYHSGLIYEPLEVVTVDGYKIETWFYPAQEVSDSVQSSDRPLPFTTLDDTPRPTLIIAMPTLPICRIIKWYLLLVMQPMGIMW